MHCTALPDTHRGYVQGLAHGDHRTLIARTALPADTEEVRKAGKAAYITFTHRLASSLELRLEAWSDAMYSMPTQTPGQRN
eukprot:6490028-Amphidinium_carterae.2